MTDNEIDKAVKIYKRLRDSLTKNELAALCLLVEVDLRKCCYDGKLDNKTII